mmetsp:Transcript_5050/g.7301  ORF Transcript_5050/g.7301 Transcript_5050/m.7301 type:complete len:525 (-) Transcript_5050:87-1661(-)|eukprot:CAMPEP_0194248146 /NCGR_PEP_ID=MMETSP0158-20130606/17702_1 /TAXON_ID=33649 /ORGANISM="Thalassionema nitzschioides, Strain L26-B" /LENGTH=524 /DNA_ID=CAMNT_0038984357 /DNA_START=55 /DNA_END=1629 /DNA_ORIENTATION=-
MTTTPPRLWNKKIGPPHLIPVTPVSDASPRSGSTGSSSSNSPSRFTETISATTSTLVTSRSLSKTNQLRLPFVRNNRADASIMRGAALVRKNLTNQTYNNSVIMDPVIITPQRSSDDDFDGRDEEFSDIWRNQQQDQNEGPEAHKFDPSRMGYAFSPTPSSDEEIHWATNASAEKLERENVDSHCRKNHNQPSRLSPTYSVREERCIVPPSQLRVHRDRPLSRASSPTPSDATPETRMGRNKSLRVKMVTYHVQPTYEIADDTTYDDSGGSYDGTIMPSTIKKRDASEDLEENEDPLPSLLSPLTRNYKNLQTDIAYQHAQKAGYLWQSLAGQHVRFPKHWFDSLRSPPMGADTPWQYIARHEIDQNPFFLGLIRNRSEPGRLLLHLVIRDFMNGFPVLDVAIGAYHPNARGIRSSQRPDPNDNDVRHVWMAIRKRNSNISLIDSIFYNGKSLNDVANESPIGRNKRCVTNVNMRAVFGERPPIHTICIQESELWEKLSQSAQSKPEAAHAPAMLILQEFMVMA